MSASSAAAQQAETVSQSTISPVALEFTSEGLAGPGGEVLREAMERAQFVSIGEDHGYADAPRLLAAIGAEGRAFGFDNYGIEVGPYSTTWLTGVLREGGPDALAAALAGRPLAVPFLTMREEAEAAMQYLEDGRLWGVDQEFIGSPSIHLEYLRDAGGSNPDLVADLLARERQAFATGDQRAAFVMAVTDDEWAGLEAAFADNDDALARLAELKRSTAIYRSIFAGRGLDNNLDRIALIREYFLAAYHEAERREGAPPKVVMKFGAVHAGRATSPMSTFDLGMLVEGMAAANGMEALHIAYLPLAGEQTAISPSPDGFFSTKPTEAAKLRALLELADVDLATIDASPGHFLIDLEAVKRRLRNKGLTELGGMERFVVLGFDYLVTTSAGKPATPLVMK